MSWTLFNKDKIGWVRGTPGSISVTPAVVRMFCELCGSPLTFEFSDSSEIIGVTTGTLDEPDKFLPTRHNWTKSEVTWLNALASLPQNPGDAGDEKVSI